MNYPTSPKETVGGLVYVPRLCNKVRMHAAGELHEDYQSNLGRGFDLWTCQFLEVEYEALVEQVQSGKSDEEVLEWAFSEGNRPTELQTEWWNSYMRNRGLKDDFATVLETRISDSGFEGRGILSFFDYIDADEER